MSETKQLAAEYCALVEFGNEGAVGAFVQRLIAQNAVLRQREARWREELALMLGDMRQYTGPKDYAVIHRGKFAGYIATIAALLASPDASQGTNSE